MRACVGVDHRRDVQPAEAVRRGDLQVPGDLATPVGECLGERVDRVGDRGAVLRDQRAFVREPEPPGTALEQPHADPRLKRVQALGNGRRRDVQLARALGERGGAGEDREEGEVVGVDH